MKDGYFLLGEAKGVAYILITAAFAILCTISALIGKKKIKDKLLSRRIFPVMAGFLLTNLITFLFSEDKTVSFFGLSGWRCGFLTVLLMIFTFFALSLFAEYNRIVVRAALVAPAAIFVWGILNRCGIYPVVFFGQDTSFLASIGNINWYAGFLSIFVPLGMGLAMEKKLFSREFVILGIYIFLGNVSLILQGSDAGAITFFGSLAVLFLFTVRERESYKKFLVQLFISGLSMEACFGLFLLIGEEYTYQDSLPTLICKSQVGIILMALAFFLYRLTRLFEEVKADFKGRFYERTALITSGVLLTAAFVFVLSRAFTPSFGNDRGLIWGITLDMFNDLSAGRKLFGVGQDCFYNHAYSDVYLAEKLDGAFNGDTLTNAHCDILSILIEKGLAGLCMYLTVFISAVKLFWQNKKESKVLVFALPVITYFLNSLISFSQPLSTPYFYICMGLGVRAVLASESGAQKAI